MSQQTLSKRERQLMDVIFQLGEASAADVHQRMPNPPTYTAVRTMLRLLESKALIEHRQEGRRYIYTPCRSPKSEGRSALHRVLEVFFGGSLKDAVAAHLSDPNMKLNPEELKRLREVIDQADLPSGPKRKPKNDKKGTP